MNFLKILKLQTRIIVNSTRKQNFVWKLIAFFVMLFAIFGYYPIRIFLGFKLIIIIWCFEKYINYHIINFIQSYFGNSMQTKYKYILLLSATIVVLIYFFFVDEFFNVSIIPLAVVLLLAAAGLFFIHRSDKNRNKVW